MKESILDQEKNFQRIQNHQRIKRNKKDNDSNDESQEYLKNIEYYKKIAHEDYLKYREISANQTKLHDQYLIWLSAGVLAIAFPQILGLIDIINSTFPILLLSSAIFLIFTLLLCFNGLKLSTKLIEFRLNTLDYIRINGEENEQTESNDKEEYCLSKHIKRNDIHINVCFTLGIIFLIIFISINYKIINI